MSGKPLAELVAPDWAEALVANVPSPDWFSPR